jgi:hypothetical protein
MAVALPLSKPVTVVVSVMAGVVEALATVPAKPFADTTDTEVTEPVPEMVCHVGSPPDTVKTCPEDPIPSPTHAVPFAYINSPAVTGIVESSISKAISPAVNG